MNYFFYEAPLNKKTAEFMGIPVIFTVIPVALLVILTVALVIVELRNRKQIITKNSIKESLDNLPAGLCFAMPDGRILLSNHCMGELCFSITDEELQNAEEFWKILKGGALNGIAIRLASGENPQFRLPDGSIWLFSRSKVYENYQITATEITQLHKLSMRLREKNENLENMNERLRKYGENVDELTRSRERLETKERIHNSLGQALLATRHSIDSKNTEVSELVEMWKRNISVLKTGSEINKEEYTLDVLFKAAYSAGITIDLSGELPENGEIRKLFVIAATQALTNAVRHAGAKTLYIAFKNSADTYSVRFTNDGKRPENEITEGGGLENLRKRVERMNGQMRVISKPRYALEITIDAKADESGC
jgi:signal transduction histidine kinase